jgi:hypothetical protein
MYSPAPARWPGPPGEGGTTDGWVGGRRSGRTAWEWQRDARTDVDRRVLRMTPHTAFTSCGSFRTKRTCRQRHRQIGWGERGEDRTRVQPLRLAAINRGWSWSPSRPLLHRPLWNLTEATPAWRISASSQQPSSLAMRSSRNPVAGRSTDLERERNDYLWQPQHAGHWPQGRPAQSGQHVLSICAAYLSSFGLGSIRRPRARNPKAQHPPCWKAPRAAA